MASDANDASNGTGKTAIGTVRRRKATSASVLVTDKIADWGITIGGLMVIVAVFGIMIFLAQVVVPLFQGGDLETTRSYSVTPPKPLAWTSVDEYQTIGIRITADGQVSTFHLDTGIALDSVTLDFGGAVATAVGATDKRNNIAFGFDDGTVRFAVIEPKVEILTGDSLPVGARELNDRDLTDGTAVYSRIPGNQLRRISLGARVDEPQTISEAGEAIIAIDYRTGGTVERPTRSFVTIDASGVARISRTETQINLLTRKATTRVLSSTLPELPAGMQVTNVLLTGQADQVYVANETGDIYRYDTRDFAAPRLAEKFDAFPGDQRLTVMGFLNGEQGLIAGGSEGSVRVFYRLQPENAGTEDGYKLILIRELESHSAPVVNFASSQRNKSLVTMDMDGNVWLRHNTSNQTLLKLKREPLSDEGTQMLLAPRNDAVLVADAGGQVNFWSFYVPHPEVTAQTIFGKVWYEGYLEPTYTWQSSSGTDVFEPKFSLTPLIFGTLKATVYSLIFAIPIALLGAIYTSEFLHSRIRSTVKPVMEMMESLPTVVLGFIAALLLAPIVETWIAAVLLAFGALPLSLMLAAYLWQALPYQWKLRLDGIPKFCLMFVTVAFGCYIAYAAGPLFENVFFYGDLKAWTNGDIGSGLPFLFLVLLPLSFLGVSYVFARTIGTSYRLALREMSQSQAPLVDLARWVAMLLASCLVSYILAAALTAIGYDPRGGVVDTYVQRNALVVGFVMGFAVIPNIYTLAEDALNAVPSSLRAASLAAGATPWQTAMWVVLPTAMSGVFAAVMIGMGRAVGETMIVVMAAGNTPILDWNIFNGLRTLSANIAVELPEAVQFSTLYRMLFLAALTLFAMTFVINTVAEIIRQRFRKRAFQL
jgi:phosphate transport system permease protein